jgi:hypothetical protein
LKPPGFAPSCSPRAPRDHSRRFQKMGFIERRSGKYRARYRDPLGHPRCKTFTRKADAERFVREMDVQVE